MNNKTLNKLNNVLLAAAVLFFVSACSTPKKNVTYINGIETNTTYQTDPIPEEYRIKQNDQLFIQVISDDPMNAAFLNLINTQSGSTLGNSNSLELFTYLVDNNGNIFYPKIGELNVLDKTVSDVRNKIQAEVNQYLESASVFVKLVNRNITVLGEVKNPGQKTMVKNQLSIFEALGTAGDITDWGNRKTVKIIRDLPQGRHIAELDLTDPNVIYSPYYYVLPHDIIYVENSTKVYGAKNLSYTTPVTITNSIVSIVLLIMNLVK